MVSPGISVVKIGSLEKKRRGRNYEMVDFELGIKKKPGSQQILNNENPAVSLNRRENGTPLMIN